MDSMEKFDWRKDLKQLYQPSSKEFSMIDVPIMNFLKIDGHGDPNTNPQYQKSVEALYSVAYKIKYLLKAKEIEFSVSPLEGLWWVEDMTEFSINHKDELDWTMMIMQPKWVTENVFEKARQVVAGKKDNPELSALRFESYHEGLSVQILYWGAYANEGPMVARMHDFINQNGMVNNGKHHEIYLGDPRKTVPEKLKTILRQPVKKNP